MSGKINYEKVENELEDLLVLKQAVEDLLEAVLAELNRKRVNA